MSPMLKGESGFDKHIPELQTSCKGSQWAMVFRRTSFGCAYLIEAQSDFVAHAHDRPEFVLNISGHPGRIRVGDEEVEPALTRAAAIDRFRPHSHLLAGNRGLFFCLSISSAWLRAEGGPAATDTPFLQHVVELPARQRTMVVDAVVELTRGTAQDQHCVALLRRLVQLASAGSKAAVDRRAIPNYRLRRALTVMRENLDRQFDLDALAHRAGMSRPHFFDLFFEQMNMTPGLYWNALRTGEVMRRLEETDMSIASIARDVGFSDLANFSRFFRDRLGVPPAAFRTAVRSD